MTFEFSGSPKTILDTFTTPRGLAGFNAKLLIAEGRSRASKDHLNFLARMFDESPEPSIGLRKTFATALKHVDLLLLDQIDIYADALGIEIVSYYDKDLTVDILKATIDRRAEIMREISEQIEMHKLMNPDEAVVDGELTTSVIAPFNHFAHNLASLSHTRKLIELRRLDLANGLYIARRDQIDRSKMLAVKMQGPEIGYDVLLLETQERLDADSILTHAVQNHFYGPAFTRNAGQDRGIA